MHKKVGIKFQENCFYPATRPFEKDKPEIEAKMENDESTEMRQLNPSEINRGLKKGGAPSMAKIVMRF
jgi:hypothetical protein